eukprot:TRINITY_DN29537_c0_g1_i1.p1 TRINITY_DN29537_c0_g1~~TRINITY_DN29537_c0_g1_i1.p1  ORF type:complete len:195 (+),score=54.25 TRINITY_DN29537_c0_g1_i1:30-587(+)
MGDKGVRVVMTGDSKVVEVGKCVLEKFRVPKEDGWALLGLVSAMGARKGVVVFMVAVLRGWVSFSKALVAAGVVYGWVKVLDSVAGKRLANILLSVVIVLGVLTKPDVNTPPTLHNPPRIMQQAVAAAPIPVHTTSPHALFTLANISNTSFIGAFGMWLNLTTAFDHVVSRLPDRLTSLMPDAKP